jgi:hypothetical protein
MIFLTFLSAFLLSGIAAYYSVIGLAAIFPGSFWPVVIMGSSLEFAKLITASWLYRNWTTAHNLLRVYLTVAVVVLMLITSMGIFGFLTKAHMEHSADVGPLVDKVSLYNEKIAMQRETIASSKAALSQMDTQVNDIMSKGDSEKSVERSVTIRRQQAKERASLQKDIETANKEIQILSEEKAPLAAQLKREEADVGPIKYIAALIYGDSLDNGIIDKAVRLVILLIILVFDPLAVLLLISGNISLKDKNDIQIHEDLASGGVLEQTEVQPIDESIVVESETDEREQSVYGNLPEVPVDNEVEEVAETLVEQEVEPEGEATGLPSSEGLLQIPKENVASIEESMIAPKRRETVVLDPVFGQPIKRLEPKYDYSDPYSFREKENKQ